MKNRKCRVEFRVSEDELCILNQAVMLSGLSREEYLRTLIKYIIPSNTPSVEFLEVIKQLRIIGNNMNQIAVIAHKTGSIDVLKYKRSCENLQETIIKVIEIVNQPRKLEMHNGNNKDMGS